MHQETFWIVNRAVHDGQDDKGISIGCHEECELRHDRHSVQEFSANQMESIIPWEDRGAVFIKLQSSTVAMDRVTYGLRRNLHWETTAANVHQRHAPQTHVLGRQIYFAFIL